MLAVDRRVFLRHVPGGEQLAGGAHDFNLPANHADLRRSAQGVHLFFKPLRQRNIIRIHPGNKLPLRTRQHFIERPDQAGVRPGHQADPGIALRIFFQDRQRAIGRAIVDNLKFKIPERLVQDAFNRAGNIALGVVDRHQD